MAATAGTMTLIGKSGQVYIIDCYVPDAVATFVTFNPTGLAGTGSSDSLRVPEDCVVSDLSIAATPTAVGGVYMRNSGVINGSSFRHANQLSSLVNRQRLNIAFKGGDFLKILQH